VTFDDGQRKDAHVVVALVALVHRLSLTQEALFLFFMGGVDVARNKKK
jgi:hypothetical protein